MTTEHDLELASYCNKYKNDPLGFILWAYDWDNGELKGHNGPDEWQRDFLIGLGEQIRERDFKGVEPVDPVLMAVTSGHGIGKSAMSAWLVNFILSTRPMSRGVLTANTGPQLKSKTMPEVAKWNRRSLTGHWFECQTMSVIHREFPDNWRVDALTSREEQSEAFAGLHAADSTPWYLFDEASAIPEKIWEVAQGGLTDGEPMFFAFGNPTRNTGSFADCFGKNRHRWKTTTVDSRTARMTNKKLISTWINDFGIDSDFVRVRVLGKFPKGSDMQFIPTDIVQEAMSRSPGTYFEDDPLIVGVDMARGGNDNCVVQFRRGFDAKSDKAYRIPGESSRDSMKVVSLLTMVFDRHKPDVIFIDKGSMGGPVGDRLRQLGYNCIDIGFGENADDSRLYNSRTSEMGDRLKRWLFDGGAIRQSVQLELELTGRDFSHNDKDQLVLEKKKDMKKRLGYSPDEADALMLTFAQPVPKLKNSRAHREYFGKKVSLDYNPIE